MDLTGWLDFVEGLATQMEEVRARGQQVIKADVLAAKHRLNARAKSPPCGSF
jgi:cell filamentation protein, protein adenylyltransferase